jgi:hypothetical protein
VPNPYRDIFGKRPSGGGKSPYAGLFDQPEKLAPEGPGFGQRALGLLGSIGHALDTPRRKLTALVTGDEEKASGRDLLEKLGVLSPNTPGFDIGDLVGFGTELVTDPLTYVGGVGALNKYGRAAKSLKLVKPELAAAKSFAKTATTVEDIARWGEKAAKLEARGKSLEDFLTKTGKAAKGAKALKLVKQELAEARSFAKTATTVDDIARWGEKASKLEASGKLIEDILTKASKPLELGKTAADQSRQGLRSALTLHVPFTKAEASFGKITPAFELFGKGRRLLADNPVGRTVSKLFQTGAGKLPEAQPFFRAAEEQARFGSQAGVKAAIENQGLLDVAKATGRPIDDILKEISQVHEGLGIPEAAKSAGEKLISETKTQIAARESETLAKRKATLEQMASKQVERGLSRAIPMRKAAEELERVGKSVSGRAEELAISGSKRALQGEQEALAKLSTEFPSGVLAKAAISKQTGAEGFAQRILSILKTAEKRKGALTRIGPKFNWLLGDVGKGMRAEDALQLTKDRLTQVVTKGAGPFGQDALREFEDKLLEKAQGIQDLALSKSGALSRASTELGKVRATSRAELLKGLASETERRGFARAGEISGRGLTPAQLSHLTARHGAAMADVAERADPFFYRQAEAARQLAGASDETTRLAEALKAQNVGLLGREHAGGARGKSQVIRSPILGYAPRRLSKEAQALKETGQEFGRIPGSTKGGSRLAREEAIREVPTVEVNQRLAQQAGVPNWFEMDPVKAQLARRLEGERKLANSQLVQGLGEQFAKPFQVGHEPLANLLEKLGVTKYGKVDLDSKIMPFASGEPPPGMIEGLGDLAKHIETKLAEAGLQGMGVPKEVYDQAVGLVQKLKQPEEIERVLKAVDVANHISKRLLTMSPGFHVRNFISDTARSALAGNANPKLMGQVLKNLRDPERRAYYDGIGLFKGADLRASREKLLGTAAPTTRLGKVGQAYDKVAGMGEEFTRLWHFLSAQKRGLSEAEALDSVKAVLFDYSDLTQFEKKYLSRAILFYGWVRKALPSLLPKFSENPQGIAALSRLSTNPSEPRDVALPDFIRSSAAIPAGKNAQGDPRFIFGTGSPLEELNRFDPTSREGGVAGGAGAILRKLGSQLTPLLKVPAEIASGKDLFFNRPIIEQTKAGPGAQLLSKIPGLRRLIGAREMPLPGGGSRSEVDPYVNYLMNAIPTSRPAGEIGRLADFVANTDKKTPAFQNLLRVFTGARVASLDKKDLLQAQLEEKIAQATKLRRQGKIGFVEEPYARQGAEGKDEEAVNTVKRIGAIKKELKLLSR